MVSKKQFLAAVESIAGQIGIDEPLDEVSWLWPKLEVRCPDSENPLMMLRVGRDGAELVISMVEYRQVEGSSVMEEHLVKLLVDMMADGVLRTANAIKMDGLRLIYDKMTEVFPGSLFTHCGGKEQQPLWWGSPHVLDAQSRGQS